MSRASLALVVTALFALLVSAGCGGGGGGGGGDGSLGGAGPVAPGSFGVTLGPTGAKIQGLNVPVSLQFSKAVKAATANGSTIKVVTVTDPAGVSTAPPGTLASVTYSVSANVISIRPTVVFTPSKVEYGFVANALYEITFSPPFPGPSVLSTADETMVNPNSTFFFRTPTTGFDFQPGYPMVRAFVVDDPTDPSDPVDLPDTIVDQPGSGGSSPDGDLVPEAIAFFSNAVEITQAASPVDVSVAVRPILFVFDDALIPTSVVNPVNGGSPSIKVQVNAAKVPSLLPKTIPAVYSMYHQQTNLTMVLWKPKVVAFPPASFLFVTVLPSVQDLAFNTKLTITGDGGPDLTGALRVVGVDGTEYELLEPFSDKSKEDAAASSAAWAVLDASSGQLVLAPVLGGGTGADGPLVIDPVGTANAPGNTVVPPAAVIDFGAKLLSLPTVQATVDGRLPRRYAFTTVSIPQGWKVRVLTDRNGDGTPDPEEFLVDAAGHPLDGLGAPLSIQCTGTMTVDGVFDVSAAAAAALSVPASSSSPSYAAYKGQGGVGAEPLLAGGTGGDGGDVLLLDKDGAIAFPLVSPAAGYEPSDGKLRGVTGLSTGLGPGTMSDSLQTFTRLSDPGDPVLSGLLAAGEIRLQPNVGVGSSLVGNAGTQNESIDENHPTFTVDAVLDDATLSVDGADGALNQASENFATAFAPIASGGDPYLVGRLHGRRGEDLTELGRGGSGAEPYVVVNEGALGIKTTGGGGGGGGAFSPGDDGESDGPESNPFVDQRGTSGGIAKDESSGAPGGLGTVRGTLRVTGALSADVLTQTHGRPVAELAGSGLVGAGLTPASDTDGWLFTIAAFDGTTFTLDPIEADEVQIDLLDGPDPEGPDLAIGADYAFVVVPPREIGGGGGGGAGVSVTGTVNANPGVLPRLTPGAGGGGGGGSIVLETASTLKIGPFGGVLARGGAGGAVADVTTDFAGGGGGGGGNVVLRAGKGMTFFQGAVVSAEGGLGGGEAGFGRGGDGGDGYIRLEDFANTLLPSVFTGTTFPSVQAQNLGRMFGDPQGVGQSLYYEASVLNPQWTGVSVDYRADTDDDGNTEPFTWSFGETGATSDPPGLLDPPFDIFFNSIGFNDGGFLDTDEEDEVFLPVTDLVSARAGLAYDAASGVLFACAPRDMDVIHRLDPLTLAPVAAPPLAFELPPIPAAGSDQIDVVSLAVGSPDAEIFLLQRATSQVHVLDSTTGAFRRTIFLPLALDGAMTYLPPPIDLLLFADNRDDRMVTFRRLDPASPMLTKDYSPAAPVSQFVVARDGEAQDLQVVGMAYDAAAQSLWCSDALAQRLFEVDMSAGNEGVSLTGSQSFSDLLFDVDPFALPEAVPVIPSALAYDGTDLILVHATDPADGRIRRLAPGAVDPAGTGADTVIDSFGTPVVTTLLSLQDGRLFLRFRILIDGSNDSGATMFRKVRIDGITVFYDNEPY